MEGKAESLRSPVSTCLRAPPEPRGLHSTSLPEDLPHVPPILLSCLRPPPLRTAGAASPSRRRFLRQPGSRESRASGTALLTPCRYHRTHFAFKSLLPSSTPAATTGVHYQLVRARNVFTFEGSVASTIIQGWQTANTPSSPSPLTGTSKAAPQASCST